MTAALTFYFTVVSSSIGLIFRKIQAWDKEHECDDKVTSRPCLFVFVFDGNITVAVGSDRNSSRLDPRKSGRARKLETVQAQTPRREPILAPKGYIPYTLLLYTCEDSDKSQISPAARAISSGT